MAGLLRAKKNGDLTPLIEALRVVSISGFASERALADRLQVKRHQLRRALQVMRATGEIEAARPRRKSLDERQGRALARDTNPLEVIEVRLALEPFLARMAALRASPIQIARIEKAATTAEKTDAGAADLAFHKSIASGAGNSLAVGLYSVLRKVGSDTRLRLQRNNPNCPIRTQQRDAEHRAIAERIFARDPDGAEQAMRTHLLAVQKLVIDRAIPK